MQVTRKESKTIYVIIFSGIFYFRFKKMLAIDMVSVVNINYKFLHCLENLTEVNIDLYCTSPLIKRSHLL